MSATPFYCPHCHSSHRQIKWGRTSAGSQKYRCHGCERVYTPMRKSCGYSVETCEAARRMYEEGQSCRRIALLLGVHHQSVINWIYRS